MDDMNLPDDEFSMGDLEKDLKKGRGARRLPWFLTGLVLGIAGTIAIPRFAGPYLPAALRGGELLTGPVLAEERENGRLLLTVDTEAGALIASFTDRAAEIDMLIDREDVVTIRIPDYEPFVENPDVENVRKGPVEAAGRMESGEGAGSESGVREDSARTAGPDAEGAAPEATTPDSAGSPADTTGAAGGGEGGAAPDTVPPDSIAAGRP